MAVSEVTTEGLNNPVFPLQNPNQIPIQSCLASHVDLPSYGDHPAVTTFHRKKLFGRHRRRQFSDNACEWLSQILVRNRERFCQGNRVRQLLARFSPIEGPLL